MKRQILFFAIGLCLLTGCRHSNNGSQPITSDSVMHVGYAKGFRIAYASDYKTVEILSQDQVIYRYYLVHSDAIKVPTDGQKIILPLTSVATASTTHLLPLQEIGMLDCVKGVCDGQLIYNPEVQNRLADGRIMELGSSFAINMERLITLHPQALFMSVYNGGNDGAQRIERVGVPVVMNAEWKEETLLGRAEWIKYMAAFFDCEAKADSLFNDIETNYNTLKDSVSTAELPKPKVLLNTAFKGVWYMPSGRSYVSSVLRDAGSSYFYENDTTLESLPLSFEQVLYNFHDADVWISVNSNSIDEMLAIESRYSHFPVINTGRVYNFNARTIPSGANDYWEGGIMHPDIILADFIKMIHPDLLPGHSLYYATKLPQHRP